MRDRITKAELIEAIRERRGFLDMDTFGVKSPCGTVCCIAGVVMQLAGVAQKVSSEPLVGEKEHYLIIYIGENGGQIFPDMRAKHLLRVKEKNLFYRHMWPPHLQAQLDNAREDPDQVVATLIEAVEYYMEDGDVQS
jgi:hypothetical protein